jgi:hypothetical protein
MAMVGFHKISFEQDPESPRIHKRHSPFLLTHFSNFLFFHPRLFPGAECDPHKKKFSFKIDASFVGIEE